MSATGPSPIQWLGALLFAAALAHTFSTRWFEGLARRFPRHAGIFHLLGEVEVVFGLWAMVLVVAMMLVAGPTAATTYLDGREFTEPMFVFAIMVVAGSRPILHLAMAGTRALARRLPMPPGMAYYFATLSVVPLLGSFITEPAAMTLAALILRDRFFARGLSPRLAYATLGVLFVNVSIGGTLTPYAAPPVLMVASAWGWDLAFMLQTFGWKVAIAVLVNALAATLLFRKELRVAGARPADAQPMPPWPVLLAHVAFLAGIVVFAHHPVLFMGLLLFFIGFARAYHAYQDRLIVREGLLVAFFLAGLVVLGGQQQWWLDPLLRGMSAQAVYFGATALTAVTDNAALTYLGSLVPGMSDAFKYALVAGAVTGGGLTIIANAPNPAGFSILREHLPGHALSAPRLFAAALPPTLVAMAAFHLTHIGGTTMRYAYELVEWIQALEPAAAFLLMLPFVVAAAGLSQYWLERRGQPHDTAASLRAQRAPR
jgi:hypothetical protein